jgi:predicted DNA-binding transcriptional regulator YafY
MGETRMQSHPVADSAASSWSRTHIARMARLIRLICEIKANPKQTPEHLCQALGIGRARFFEDRKLLQEGLDFTFRFNRAKGTYEILNDPYLPIVNLTLSEAFALVLAVRQLSASGDYILTYEAVEGIRKIVGAAQPALRGFLQNLLDEIVWREGFGCDAAILDDLRRACLEHQHLVIAYHHYDQDTVWPHEIDPYQLFFKRRALYLDAYDKAARAFRVFRVNRIKQVQFLGVSGMIVTDYSFAERFHDTFSTFVGGETTTVKVRFTKRIAPYIKESLWHWSQQITPLPSGSILYEVRQRGCLVGAAVGQRGGDLGAPGAASLCGGRSAEDGGGVWSMTACQGREGIRGARKDRPDCMISLREGRPSWICW